MRIGLDFDNTIAGYDGLFAVLAEERGLFERAPGNKRALRDDLRRREGGEMTWRELQATVYGARMAQAELIDGVADFLTSCRQRGDAVHIVSHKTRYANHASDGTDLRAAALAWMEDQGFFDPAGFALSADDVSFHDSRGGKVARIAQLSVACFVDDLEEVFAEPEFPGTVARILFDPADQGTHLDGLTRCRDWQEIENYVHGREKSVG